MISKENLLTLMNETNENKFDLLCSTYSIHKNFIVIMKMLDITNKDLTLNRYNEGSLYEIFIRKGFDSKLIKNIECEYPLFEFLKKIKSIENLMKCDLLSKGQILLGLIDGIDVSQKISNKYDSLQIRELRFALKSGVDISHLDPEKYTCEQMEQIRFGLLHGVDITCFDLNSYSIKDIREMRISLESDHLISKNKIKYSPILN